MTERDTGVLLEVATAVRSAAEEVTRTKTLRNRCIPTSMALQLLLGFADIKASISGGFFWDRPHAWVVVDGVIVDLTMTQFDRKAPKVCLVLPPARGYLTIDADVPESVCIRKSSDHMLRLAERIKARAADLLEAEDLFAC